MVEDLLSFGINYVTELDWFSNGITCVNSKMVKKIILWRNKWFDSCTLHELFPDRSMSICPIGNILDIGV